MGLFDFFRKSSVHQKNYAPPTAFVDFLAGGFNGDLMAYEAMRLYRKCTPFYQAVNMRAGSGSSVPVNVTDTSGEIVMQHPILSLLNKPNPMQSWSGFVRAALTSFDVCGEAFFVVTMDSKKIPLEIYTVRAQDVTASSDDRSMVGVVSSWRWQTSVGSETFYLSSDETGGSYRYLNSAGDRELWQWADYNPDAAAGNYRGLSRATPLWLQIQQFIEADNNNYSVLMRGARPSVAWTWQHDQPMTDDQYERWKEQVKAYEGSQNAGRQVLVDNLKPEVISVSNRDMEFAANRKTVRSDIFSAYGIPLALVNADSMTMDNLKVSNVLLYDNAVLPLLNDFYAELSALLLPRYRDSVGYAIGYDASSVPALQLRVVDSVYQQSRIGVLTDNELRTQLGYESVLGGDVIYKPSSSVPVGEDVNTDDNVEEQRKRFIAHMREVKNADGGRAFSDEYITASCRSHYGEQ